jgi:hypothetical protein
VPDRCKLGAAAYHPSRMGAAAARPAHQGSLGHGPGRHPVRREGTVRRERAGASLSRCRRQPCAQRMERGQHRGTLAHATRNRDGVGRPLHLHRPVPGRTGADVPGILQGRRRHRPHRHPRSDWRRPRGVLHPHVGVKQACGAVVGTPAFIPAFYQPPPSARRTKSPMPPWRWRLRQRQSSWPLSSA